MFTDTSPETTTLNCIFLIVHMNSNAANGMCQWTYIYEWKYRSDSYLNKGSWRLVTRFNRAQGQNTAMAET